ncbi:protein OPAQUE1-like isoform X3 [Asparagus officinalis]|uniref:protein OPAQUE1-like isoform X3 n=1 Tax=Asparagus officinalis TaxID=4686 RepID=UPI00098E40CE|nr:protein OPAQUE1-like isoform X3 [Asparagus officinalis]
MSLKKGSAVWVEDKGRLWEEAEVIDIKDQIAVVEISNGKKIKTEVERLLLRDPDADYAGVDDMTKLTYLNEPGVLYNLERRYSLNEIYTYTGSILIAVNPFTNIPHLYNGHMMEQYKNAQFGELSPHVFAIADASYRAMMKEARSQSILVSGESGAGKTETTKLIMRYLTFVGGRAAGDSRSVEQQILESNPLLEAFGNARTVRNNNSSRFGKFVELQFDGRGQISGAAIRTYLLERSRVVKITNPERNYHVFYQLCASGKDAERYGLGTPGNFYYLNQSKMYELDGVSSAEEYMRTRRAMDVVGISTVKQEAVFRTLAAILHLGNIEFSPGSEHDSSVIKNEKSSYHLQMAANLFMCDMNLLLSTLCSRSITTREGIIMKALDCAAAAASRDALAKTVYARMFDWLVETINTSVGQDRNSRVQIGVLDIYGFECFKNNSISFSHHVVWSIFGNGTKMAQFGRTSFYKDTGGGHGGYPKCKHHFEQFCINFANEKLQQHFNEHVFKKEQEEYKKEKINWSYIEFVDNQDVLDLIEKKPIGIISLLDEACMFPKSTHEAFSMKLFQSFPAHPRLEKVKFSQTDFTLSHYAGKVAYQTLTFLDKNRDYIVVEHCNLLSSSKCSFIAEIFTKLPEEPSKSSYKFSSVASRFKQQLQALMETLKSTKPHYVRCIKPNSVNYAQKFDNQSVLQQLRCGGVLEAIRISLAGYPTRRTYSDFVDRFGILALELMDGRLDEKALTERIIQKLKLNNFQLGRTKVFLRAGQIAVLDSQRNVVLDNASRIVQCCFRKFFARKEFILTKRAAVTLQSCCRGYLDRKIYVIKRQDVAVLFIQKHARRWLLQKNFIHVCSATLVIQSSIRSYVTRQRFISLMKHRAAIRIQAWWRMCIAGAVFERYRRVTVSVQCAWRCKAAKKTLRKLKVAASEAGALREVKNKLENDLEDLTLRLTLEKRLRVACEESKIVEVSKLQTALQSMHMELDATKVAYSHELDKNNTLLDQLDLSAKDNAMLLNTLEKLNKDNLFLKNTLESIAKRNQEMEHELSNTQKCHEDTVDKLQNVESRCSLLQQNLHKLEKKLSSLEDENHTLRQKSLHLSPRSNQTGFVKHFSEVLHLSPRNNQTGVNYSVAPVLSNINQRPLLESSTPSITLFQLQHSLSDSRRSRMTFERHEECNELLQKCIKENLGFKDGKPIAACIIYKCLLHWHAFEAERTAIFDYVIEAINNVLKVDTERDILPYWLSNASALLCLLLRNLRSNGFPSTPPRQAEASKGLGGSIIQGGRIMHVSSVQLKGITSHKHSTSDDSLSHVDARYPAMLFKQQLTACLEKIFGLIRDNLKKEISPLLSLCIQAPKSSRGATGRTSKSPEGAVQQPLTNHWDHIIKFLDSFMDRLHKNYVPSFFVRKLITQVFSFINIQLFNSLLLRRECCTFSNGEYVKSGLAILEKWIADATVEFAGTSLQELNYIRQAVGFLILHQKRKKSLEDITKNLCSELSVRQIYRICTMYWDDKYSTHSVSNEVVATMRDMVNKDSQSLASNSFLLDDDLSIPFSTEDLAKAVPVVDPGDVELPSSLRRLPSAMFLVHPIEL